MLFRSPEADAFVWDGGRASYRATAEVIGRMQAVLAAAGLQRGDRVALLASNRMDGWCASMAVMASGMVSSALHPLGSTDDQAFQIDDVGAQVSAAARRIEHHLQGARA